MNKAQLRNMGIPDGSCVNAAFACLRKAVAQGVPGKDLRDIIMQVSGTPETYLDDAVWGEFATVLQEVRNSRSRFVGRERPAPARMWGRDLEPDAVKQLENACRLPVAVAAALMPDAHVGYGLPIGGVLAVENSVIPYAVGVDIACRMRLTVVDMLVSALDSQQAELAAALEQETRFGVGAKFKPRREHAVMDDPAWQESRLLKQGFERAAAQLGTSGGGNHFAEFGILEVISDDLGLAPGRYAALMSHSGSRGTGEHIAKHYSKLAMDLHTELPDELRHLAWFDLDGEAGQEYWRAMELMGRYSAANHQLIHEHIVARLGVNVLCMVENHHNFAWKEIHEGQEVVVHRKGATPASAGTFGVIPGSMGTSGYVVRGKGNLLSLNSASHGAGRAMSRTEATRRISAMEMDSFLRQRGVTLLSGGLDEAPMAYKDIEKVMAAQDDLVKRIARFDPKLVKMAPPSNRKSGWRRKRGRA